MSIYNLIVIKFENLKIYIKTNLTIGFIYLLISAISAFILFINKLNRNL